MFTSSSSLSNGVFSCSYDASLQIYEEILKPSIEFFRHCDIPLQNLVRDAEKLINATFSPDPRSVFTCHMQGEAISLKLNDVMLSMLVCVEECGGENGLRYVASAILACSKEEDIVGALEALGTTWLTHFLFIFKAGWGSEDDLQEHRQNAMFRNKVKTRDGFTCALTHFQDCSHPMTSSPNPKSEPRAYLKVAHILRPTICGRSGEHDTSQSDLASFDILVNITNLPIKTLEEMRECVDDESNGITLEMNALCGFSEYSWGMKRTKEDHVYQLKIHNRSRLLLRIPDDDIIRIEDHSDSLSPTSTHQQTTLPNPHYIAIHSALAGILHLSGAGEFCKILLDHYRDEMDTDEMGKPVGVKSWSELQRLMEGKLLRESIERTFQSGSTSTGSHGIH